MNPPWEPRSQPLAVLIQPALTQPVNPILRTHSYTFSSSVKKYQRKLTATRSSTRKREPMKFMLTFNWKPDTKTREEGINRFLKTGGQPPKGATLLGRWTRADFSGGFDLLETEDPQTLAEF